MGKGALILSEDGTILYANQTMAEMLKAPLKDVIGSLIYDWLPSSEVEPIHHGIQQLSVSRTTRTITVNTYCTPLKDSRTPSTLR